MKTKAKNKYIAKADISAEAFGVTFSSPVVTASGTFGYGYEWGDIMDIRSIGAITTKTISLRPWEGNPPPRICETYEGILNSIGLQNIGVDLFLSEKMPRLAKLKVPVIVSIAGETPQDFCELARILNGEDGICAIELNLSCPNLEKRILCQDEKLVGDILSSLRKISKYPVIAKLSPQVIDIAALAKLCELQGASAINVTNTYPGMAIDINAWRPKLSTIVGGLSGPCIKPLSLRCVWLVSKAVKIPLIGGGGIQDYSDAVEFFLAGASLVSVGTSIFREPATPAKINQGLRDYMSQHGLRKISDMVGKMSI